MIMILCAGAAWVLPTLIAFHLLSPNTWEHGELLLCAVFLACGAGFFTILARRTR